MKGGSKPKNRMALCHPNRKHVAKGMCQACYQGMRNAITSPKGQAGLVRVPVKGWGSI